MKKQNNFKYSIVIPTYNHCDDLLKPCLDSIVAHSNMSETEIVVVANGCVDNTRSYVTELKQQYPSINLVWFDEGIGFTKATNAGIKVAQGKFVLLLNNDTVIYGKNWLDTLSEPFSDSNIGATGIHEIYSAEIKHNFLVGYCLMTRREMFEEVGMLDEIFSPGFGEDIDFCAKILAKGYKLVNVDANQKMNGILMVGTFPLYHKGSSTFHDEEHNVKYEKIVHRNIGILQERYSKPQVNIIIPTYKRYELLKECLDSVLQQTYKNINVIVVSDGYDTTTESIVNSYSDERIKFNFYNTTEHEGNFGSKPRIYGIEQLDDSGYVCFLDDDNILYPEYIEKMVNNDGQISICKITTVLTEENLFKTIPAVENSIPSLGDIDSLNFMVPNVVAKKCKEKWNQVGPDIRHDYDFISECMKTENGKFKYIPEILAEHRLIQSARNGKTRFLVTLVNFGDTQLNYLNQVIDSFKLFDKSKYEIDIVVHSNIDIDRKDVDVVVHKEAPGFLTANGEVYKDWLYFPWVCRQTIYDRRNDYDIFLYNENDHLYTQKNVDSFLEMSRILPDDKVTGFMRYEEYPEMKMGKFYPDYFYMNEWKFNSTFKIGNEIFAEFSNLHHGGFLLTKSQLNKVIENSVIFTGESKFLNPFRRIEISQYMPRERACVDVYESGLTKVIPISRFDDFCIHHLPNVYLDRLGVEGGRFDSNVMKPAVDKMLSGHKMKYSIVIPTYNHCEDLLKPCIESIIANTDLSETEVIVMANGCVDNTVEYVKSLGFPFKLIYHKEQLGYTKATNFGLQAASGEYIVLLNNDVVIQPHPVGWLNLLREPFDDNEKVGMTGPLLFKGVEGVSNDFIMFFCAMTTRKIIDEVGYLDEIFAPGGVEDVDYGLRLTLAGYELVEVSSVSNRNHSLNMGAFPIYHPGNSTYGHEEGWNEILVRNNEILKQKFPEHFKGLDWIEKMKQEKLLQDLPNGWFETDEIERLRELTQKMPDNGIMVQIGVYRGKSVCALKDLILQKNLTVLAVDIFECNELGFFKNEFEQNIKNFNLENNVKTYMMTSVEASKYVSDKSIDLIFIDGDHSYDAVKLDIKSWSPKLKHDGIICGHDYSTWHGVKLAVDEAFGENVENIKGVWSLKNDRNLHQEMLNEDELTYKEIFEINVNQVDPQELVGKTIIDVGANKGYFAIYCAERGAKEVYSYEPVKDIYKKLVDFTSGFDNIHSYNLAILDGSIDEVCMHEAGAGSNIWGKEGEPTRCISLKEALESVDYKTDMILKLDCEGSEYEILFNTPKEIIRQFGIIYLEVHNEMNPNYMNKHEELLNYITSLGYNAKKGPQAGTSYPNGTWVPGPISLWKLTRHEENITIGYIDYDREVFNSHLCESIKNLDGAYDIVDVPASGKAAKDYNDIIKKSDNRYILLIHQDMEIPADFLESVRKTINEHPDFGVLGLVGYDSFENHNRNTIFSEAGKSKETIFFDSCCVLINKDNNIHFDEETFDELHMYVEDYCMQAIQKGLKNYTFNVSYESTKHFGATYYKSNEMWGRYGEYYEKFMNKWKQIHFLDSLEENIKPMDPIMYDDMFVVNSYCDEPVEFKGKTLIDIGGYRGFYTLKGLKNGIKNALVFEPQPRHYDLTKKNLELFPQVQVFNKAVADKNTKSVSITNQEGASNIYITENLEKNDDIECTSLSEILKSCQPNSSGFILKLDCEGAEYDIIQDTTKEELSVFDFIYTEVHNNIHPNPEYNQERFFQMMKEKGFDVVAKGPVYGMWYGDKFVPNVDGGTFKFKRNESFNLDDLKKQSEFLFGEIFEYNVYNHQDGELKDQTVIDIGANIGTFSIFALMNGAKKVYAFEPNIENFNTLVKNTKQFPNIIPINKAINSPGIKTCYTVLDDVLCQVKNDDSSEHNTECMSLEEAINITGEETVAVKIDCEGSEYDIFLPTSDNTLNRIKIIYSEFHNDMNPNKDYTISMLKEFLEAKNFIYKEDTSGRSFSCGVWMPDGSFVPAEQTHDTKNLKFVHQKFHIESLLPELKKDDDIVFYEIFERNMYMVNADELKNSTVIDLGANIGMFSLFALKHGAEKIYSYEPNAVNFEKLKKYTKSFNNIQPINLAVCGKPGTVYVNGADMKGTSSVNNEAGEYPVECITLESIIDERNEKDLVLKIDVEGSEYDILYSCPTEKLKRFNTIYAEFHDNPVFDKDGLISKDALKQYIVDLGYNVEVSPEVLWGYKHDGTAEPMTNISTLKFTKKDNKPKVYDCFPFFNELDLLEIRLNELDGIVDKFVITESRTTHSGKPKPMYLSDNLNRFEKFKDKIVIIDTDLENIPQDAQMNPDWIREHMQRDGCIEYLKSVCKPGDYVIVSDADEIPTESAVRKYISDNTDKVGVLVQDRFMYFLNYKNIQTDEPQLNSKILKYEMFNPFDLNAVRYSDKENIMPTYRIENAGWHFTFMGGVDKVIEKVKAFAHQEYNTEEKINYERMLKLFETGKDVYSANTAWTLVDIDESFPKLVQQKKHEYLSRGWIKEKFNEEKTMNEDLKVTATVSTRNRYFSTLPTCIQAIALQNHVPDELIIYDDNPEDKRIDLREESLYQNLFSLLSARGINWSVSFGSGEGQVKNHQRALTESAHELIWRLDDDNAPAPNVLETLLKYMKKDTGAVAGLIIDPKSDPKKNPIASNKIEDIYFGLNEQWFMDDFGYKEVDHLYSSFLFRKAAAKHGYEQSLSRVGHREETIFTYQMKVNGWKVGITSECITWHYNNPQGGIRDNTKIEMWKHDEDIFAKKMKEWNINGNKKSFIVLNNGIGDHYAFKTLLPRIKEKYKNVVLATCYPEIFEDEKEITQISIAEASAMLGDLSQWDIYKFMADHNWKESIVKAYEKLYLS